MLLSLCICNSCQKKFEEPNDVSPAVTAEFKAKINGVQFIAVLAGASIRPDGVITMAAESGDRQMITFAVRDSGVYMYTCLLYTSDAADE